MSTCSQMRYSVITWRKVDCCVANINKYEYYVGFFYMVNLAQFNTTTKMKQLLKLKFAVFSFLQRKSIIYSICKLFHTNIYGNMRTEDDIFE